MNLFEQVLDFERQLIEDALIANRWIRSHAAADLGISHQALIYSINNKHPELMKKLEHRIGPIKQRLKKNKIKGRKRLK